MPSLSEDVLSPATDNVESTRPSRGVDVIHYGTDRFASWILPRISGQYNLSMISCRNLVLDDLSALHHKFDSLKFGNVGQWIAGYGNHVGEFPLVD